MTRKYGSITVERHTELQQKLGTRVSVFLNGQDVTFRCIQADDVVGRVVLLCNDMNHRDWECSDLSTHFIPDAGELGPCVLKVSGDVNIAP